MNILLGKKLGMTRVFKEDGTAIAVTILEAGPCPITAIRTREKHGYDACQIGFGNRRAGLNNKPYAGLFKAAAIEPKRYLKEVRLSEASTAKVGDLLTVEMFKEGEKVDVIGMSRGLGFAGVMKRHNFGGGKMTHGQSDRQRAPGSVGASSYPSRTFRGQRMAGRMGGDAMTAIGLRVIRVIPQENLLLVKGSVPGSGNSLLKIRKSTRR